jgi:hypothetical protein
MTIKTVNLIYRSSLIVSKNIINREGLLTEICGNNQSKQQVEANVLGLIFDIEKSISTLKQLNKLVDYEH